MLEVIEAFIAAMVDAGVYPVQPIHFVHGKLIRFRALGDKPNRENGWAILYYNVKPFGHFGHWRLGIDESWEYNGTLSAEEVAKLIAGQVEPNEDAAEFKDGHDEAKVRAETLWEAAHEAASDHPYLIGKRLPPLGVRQLDDTLLVPMLDREMVLWNLQRILPDGAKRFLKGGRTKGLFWAYGSDQPDNGPLVIGEGYATMAAIHIATGYDVVAAMSAKNLGAVARDMRALFPTRKLILAADNDLHLEKNEGLIAAKHAALAVGAALVTPEPEDMTAT